MKRKYTSLFLFSLFSTILVAGGNPSGDRVENNGEEITYVKNTKKLPNTILQHNFRQQKNWKNFIAKHGNWHTIFNETNGKPRRAFGQPISITGASDKDKALNFAKNNLKEFILPIDDLVFQSSYKSTKHTFINMYQTYQGLKVLESEYTLRLNSTGDKVIMFGANVYNDIEISTSPLIASFDIKNYSKNGVTGDIQDIDVKDQLLVLPIEKNTTKNEYKLVYEVWVKTISSNLIPSNFYTLVDANNGEILYRQDMISHCGDHCTKKHDHFVDHSDHSHASSSISKKAVADGDVQINGTVYITDPQDGTSVVGLPNIQFTANGNNYTTDGSGFVATGEAAGVSLNIPLSGLYSTVRNNGTTPSVSTTMNATSHIEDFDANATIDELSAYYGVNVIHDYMKSVLPSFNGMDFSLTTNVDINPHECNAFYDGSSINFYVDGSACYSLAKVSDVIYHEYGHGINDNFYQSQGSFFQNGGMNEGYADVWAFAPNEDPVLGDGHNPSSPTDYIRIYSIDPKVYPEDLVGQVHADGEIIAGAWWDLYLNLGNDMATTMSLFAGAYPGLQAATANGNEGVAFTNVLIDVLLADDDDGNLANGTPNSPEIIDAFDKHGITLVSNAELDHTPILTEEENQDVLIDAELILAAGFIQYVDQVNCSYMINNSGVWNEIPMTNTTGDFYEATIPGQPKGTVIAYYLNAVDINGKVSAVTPVAANLAEPNLPNYIMVGYTLKATEDGGDFEDFGDLYGNWTIGAPGDAATTGVWVNTTPVGTSSDGYQCAPNEQNTDGGELCWVTGKSNDPSALGENDVDGGKTTLTSPVMDLTEHSAPAISYYRWYTNNPPTGANPGADWFQVEITNDGTNWEYVENTKVSDNSWRRNVIRVEDYVSVTDQIQMRFIASDSIRPGQNLDGGSLIEAALDDIQIWDEFDVSDPTGPTVDIDEVSIENSISIYPNPNSGSFKVAITTDKALQTDLKIRNVIGQLIYDQSIETNTGNNIIAIDNVLQPGIYMISLEIDSKTITKKITVE